jgi:zinc protease
VGDIDPQAVVARLQSLLGDAPAAAAAAPTIARDLPRQEPIEVFRFLTKEQAHAVIGYPGTTLNDPDRFALEILAQILSGQGGRLFVELREKRALAYRVSAFSMEGLDPGYFAVYIACSPDNLEEAVSEIRSQVTRVVSDGVTDEEVGRARKYLIGTHAIGLQRKSAIASALAFHEAYGQGWREYRRYPEQIARVTVADVQAAARKYLVPQRQIVAVVKPKDETPAATRARSEAAARGPRLPVSAAAPASSTTSKPPTGATGTGPVPVHD